VSVELAKVDHADDRAALASILNELAVDADESSDRSRARRIVGDVVSAWPGPADNRWMVWACESGQSLGRPARIVDCTAEQAVALAHHGSAVIARPAGSDSWIAFVGGDSSRVRCLQPLGHPPSSLVKRSQAVRTLRKLCDKEILRFVVLDTTHLHAADQSPDQDHHDESPFKRYWSLLAPESLDILTIIAFSIVTGLLAMATPLAVEALVSTVAFGRLLQPVVMLALILLGFLTFSAALRALQIFVVEILQRRLFARIAASLAFRLPRAQVQALEHHYAPELVNRFFEVVTVQKATAMLLLDGIALVISTLVGMAVLALYHPWLLGFDVVLLALITFAIFVLGRGAVKTSINESKAKYRTASWLEDIAACPTAFRYDGAAEFALERADRHIFDYLSARKKHFRILIRQMLFALALQAVAGTVLLGLGGWLVISGQLTLGQLVAAELIVAVIVGAFTKLGKHLENFYDVMASVDKLGHLFDIPVERQDGQLTLPEGHGVALRLSNVGYRYASGEQGLASIDWEVEPGSRWAVTGADGCGKSTLLDLLYGLRQPSQGTLALNGVSPRELRPDVLRRDVALSRGVEIFGGSIAENIHLMRPELALADVHEALEFAGLLRDVLAYPAGIDTALITGDGRPLTQGRLHRLMIARAVIGRPRLLLIDGTLDALPDDEASAIVQRLIDPSRRWTVIVTTTRRATAELFPQRIELDRASWKRMSGREGYHDH
jgi:ABC-type bacteriocin/lantibiotic exporter with double-glycine peptidase domain